MKNLVKSTVLGLALVASPLFSQPVSADQVAAEGNQLAAIQSLDILTTVPGTGFADLPGRYERNPLAQPFYKHTAELVLVSAAVNFGLRIVFKHSPLVLRYLKFGDAVAVGNNFVNLSRR